MPRPIRATYRIPYGAQFGAMRAAGKRRHNGTDYHCPIGTPICGTENGGRVTSFGYNGDPWNGEGHWVRVIYPSGSTVDMHMRERTPLAVGSGVNSNTVIGYVGITGNAVNADPPGAHVHHERRNNNGYLVNPEVYYGGSPAGGQTITPIEEDDMFSDDDRKLLQNSRPIREIISGPDGTAWYCYERLVRYAIPSERNLNTYRTHLRLLGYDDSITPKAAADLSAYGVPVFDIGNVNYGVRRSELSAMESRLLAVAGEGGPGGSGVSLQQITDAVKAALVDLEVDAGPTAAEIARAVRAAIIKD